MQSQAATVDAYLQEVPPDRKEALTQLRELCLRMLPGYQESMEYGMACYSRAGEVEVGFASQRNYIALYVNQDVLDKHREQLPDVGKGCIRYRKPDRIDFAVVEQLLRGTAASAGPAA